MTDVRTVAYEALLLADDGKTFGISGDVIEKHLYLPVRDRSFLKRLIEGTIERRITIDHVLELYSSVPVRKMKKQVRTLLRMGTYQLLFMEGVADHAAVNETVRIAKKTAARGLSGFVNGVLRAVLRNRDNISWPERGDDIVKYMSVMYSCPEWIVKKLIDEQGEDNAETVLALSVKVRPVTARVNTSKCTVAEALGKCNGTVSDIIDTAVILHDIDGITGIPAFSDGLICIQDISSMLVCYISGIRKGDTVLDLCAAPGGKSLHAADIATQGKVIACDISAARAEKIRENAARCGFTNIEVRTADAAVYDASLENYADVVIADVPCSGIGVMGRKNDIRYNITPEGIKDLVHLQRSILANAARYVKPGGVLMFSTCTVSHPENQENFEFLTGQCNLAPVDFYDSLPDALKCETARSGWVQLYGKGAETDGFFIGKLRK